MGSRLLHVSDDVTTDYGQGDFQDGNTSATDYTYDPSGNLSVDQNKDIVRADYTHFNKPSRISFGSGRSIEYSYDAAGNKVQELIFGSDTKRTDYIANFVYTNDTVQYAQTGSGRTTFKITGAGITNKEEFFVKDHLGNVRSVTDLYTYPIEEYLAGYEIASANLENLFFERIDQVRDDKPGSTWIEDLKSARLNGGDPARRIGTSLLVHVMAGDMVEMNVNNFYDGYNPADDTPLDPSTMLSNIAGTLTGGSGGYVGGEQHNTSLVGSMFNSTNYTAFDAQVKAGTDTSKPRAYLNYLLFDENKQLVSSMSGSFQANGNGTWTAIGTSQPLTVPQNGYLAVYLSSSTNVLGCLNCGDVFFDQLVFRLSRGNLKEENHYYPFGLPIAGMSSSVPKLMEQRRKYQSNEYIKDLGLNWMDFHARQYDPQIGRFLGVDPLADADAQEEINPYAAMGNAPESMIDPNGEQFTGAQRPSIPGGPAEYLRAMFPTLGRHMQGGDLFSMEHNPIKWNMGASGSVTTYTGEAARSMFAQLSGQTYIAGDGKTGGNNDVRSLPITDEDGDVIVWGKRPNWAQRSWGRFKRGVISLLRRADAWVTGHNVEKFANQSRDGGGIEFTAKNDQGTRNSGYTATHPDGKSVEAQGLLGLMGNLSTPGSAMFSIFGARVINFTSVADNINNAISERSYDRDGSLSGQVYRMGITEKTNDTMIYIKGNDGSSLLQSIQIDSLKNYEYAGRNEDGKYNSTNVLKHK